MLDELSEDAAQRLNNLYACGLLMLRCLFILNRENQPQNRTNRSSDVDNTLWVDRYRPQRFMELMGNERAARDTLTWVKQWDWCVFGKNKGKKRFKDDNDNDNEDEHDEYQRPKQKVRTKRFPRFFFTFGIDFINSWSPWSGKDNIGTRCSTTCRIFSDGDQR